MNRRAILHGLGALLVGTPMSAHAQMHWDFRQSRPPWHKIPTVTVVSRENDARLAAAPDAVAYWNAEFLALETRFRFGIVREVVGPTMADRLAVIIARGLADPQGKAAAREVTARIRDMPGDVFILLADGHFTPFALPWVSASKALAAIPTTPWAPTSSVAGNTLEVPTAAYNVRNTIAHELGHVVGLGHAADPGSLMCDGKRDAWCVVPMPDARIPPLTAAEKRLLAGMYPTTWRPGPARDQPGFPPRTL